MYVERNIVSGRYGTKDFDDSDNEKDSEGNYTVWVISKDVNVVTPYTYDEAISMAGHGPYTVSLLVVCSLSQLAMYLDTFGFSTVVTGSSCDLEIGQWQQNVLLSMPFLSAMFTGYVWGYIIDTRGRRLSLIISMWGAFIATMASAFSPNWVVLAVLKFISASFSTQASSYMLIGECCPVNVKRAYFFILSSVMHLALPIYTALGYVSLNMSFSWNLGFITFTPWRLLVLSLGLPLGVSAVCLRCFYESPKFLANMGENGLALETLRAIWRGNRYVGKKYPVEKLILEEEARYVTTKGMPLLQSLWQQTVPLFKKPLLLRTLQLYILNIVVYSTTSSLMIWFPFLVNAFLSGMLSPNVPQGMCKTIQHLQNFTDSGHSLSCVPKLNITVVWASTVQGLSFAIFNVIISCIGNRKLLIIVIMMIISASAAGCAVIENNVISLFLFSTISLGVVINGIVSSYFVDFFPTSHRGMAACLSVIVSSASGLLGSNISGPFIISQCLYIFYLIAATIFCGVLVACFLPSDTSKARLTVQKPRNKLKKKKLSM